MHGTTSGGGSAGATPAPPSSGGSSPAGSSSSSRVHSLHLPSGRRRWQAFLPTSLPRLRHPALGNLRFRQLTTGNLPPVRRVCCRPITILLGKRTPAQLRSPRSSSWHRMPAVWILLSRMPRQLPAVGRVPTPQLAGACHSMRVCQLTIRPAMQRRSRQRRLLQGSTMPCSELRSLGSLTHCSRRRPCTSRCLVPAAAASR